MIYRRTFEAKRHPKGSAERKRLNESAITSEYMPSYRYAVIGTGYSFAARTRAEAEEMDR